MRGCCSLLSGGLGRAVVIVFLAVGLAGGVSAQVAEVSAASQTPGFGGFYAAPDYGGGDGGSIATLGGDFNHDGKPDVVTVDSYGGVRVLLNDGTGKLAAQPLSYLTYSGQLGSTEIDSAVAADVNGDGYTDLILGCSVQRCTSNTVGSSNQQVPTLFILLNQKNGKFGPATLVHPTYPSGGGAYPEYTSYGFAVAKTTASGHEDIVVTTEYEPDGFYSTEIVVQTLVNNGSGGFTAKPPAVIAASSQEGVGERTMPVVADVNHDGKIDLLVERDYNQSASQNQYVYVMLGNGDGTFQLPTAGRTVAFPNAPYYNEATYSDLVAQNLTSDAQKIDLILNDQQGIFVALSNGDGTYQAPKKILSPTAVNQILVADVNGDGKNDLLAIGEGVLTTYLGKGDGTFGAPASAATAYGEFGYDVGFSTVLADFNGDGRIDFANGDENGYVEVALGGGDGSFAATPVLESAGPLMLTPDRIPSILTADLNGDGIPDLVGAYYQQGSATGNIVSGLANGHGGFTYVKSLAVPTATYLQYFRQAGDFNGDGKQDLVLVAYDGSIGVALSNGDGTFKAPAATSKPPKPLACGNDVVGAVGDINGDGKLDLILPYDGDSSCNQGTATPAGFLTYLGNGDGTFKPATFTATAYEPQLVALGHFNGASQPLDLVVYQYGGKESVAEVTLLEGKGDGSFGSPTTVISQFFADQILTDDFNLDGRADLTLMGYSEGSNPGPCIYLFAGKGDGTFTAQSPLTAAADLQNGSYLTGVYADMNGDGIPDLISDLESQTLSVRLGKGAGAFESPLLYQADSDVYQMTPGKFLGDNTVSILATAEGGVQYFMNQGGSLLTLKASASSITVGQSVTLSSALTATLTDQPEPTGTVSFLDGAGLLGSVAVNGAASAQLTASKLAVGTHTIVAKYSGDGHFNPNTSTALVITVKAASALTLAVTPSNLTFGSTVVGKTSGAQLVTVRNTGGITVSLDALNFAGADASSFAVSAKTCESTLAVGASCTFSVVFKPAKAGASSAAMRLFDNAVGSPQVVELAGTGAASALTLAVTPSNLTFGSTVVGKTSGAQPVTVRNTGGITVSLDALNFAGADAASFAVSAKTCESTLAVGASCTFSVVFKPAKAGASSAAMRVFDNAVGSPQLVELAGTGVASALTLAVTPSNLTFGSTVVGQTSGAQPVTVRNTGGITVSLDALNFAGADASSFAVSAKTCESTLAVGASCTFSVVFKPAKAGGVECCDAPFRQCGWVAAAGGVGGDGELKRAL